GADPGRGPRLVHARQRAAPPARRARLGLVAARRRAAGGVRRVAVSAPARAPRSLRGAAALRDPGGIPERLRQPRARDTRRGRAFAAHHRDPGAPLLLLARPGRSPRGTAARRRRRGGGGARGPLTRGRAGVRRALEALSAAAGAPAAARPVPRGPASEAVSAV